jgi:hypothetical protein
MGFWGLDLTGGAYKKPLVRATDCQNLLWEGEALRCRKGLEKFAEFDAPLHGIFFWEQEIIVHAGTCLYRLAPSGEKELLYSEMNAAPSVGFVRYQEIDCRRLSSNQIKGWDRYVIRGNVLFINDGCQYLFYYGAGVYPVTDEWWRFDATTADFSNSKRYHFYATVPVSATGRLPGGEGGDVDPRGDNRLSQFHCESFCLSQDEKSSSFVFNHPFAKTNPNVPPEVLVRDQRGVWCPFKMEGTATFEKVAGSDQLRLILPLSIDAGRKVYVDKNDKVVRYDDNSSDYIAADGLDNLRIIIAVYKDYPVAINGSSVQGFYGPDGTDNVLFLGGCGGVDSFSAPEDYFCFYSTSVESLGDRNYPVTGYCRLNDGRLAVLKNEPEGANVYFRNHTVVSVGTTQEGVARKVDAYPSRSGAAVEGCVSSLTVGIAGNEPVFLSNSGLYGVRSVSDELTNLDETVRRSIPVDPMLSSFDPTSCRAICHKGYYYLFCGSDGLVTDGRRDSSGQLRFLKWKFPCEISAVAKKDSVLYFGDREGGLHRFGESTTDSGAPIVAYWYAELPAEDGGRIQNVRQIAAAFSPMAGAKVEGRLYKEFRPLEFGGTQTQTIEFSEAVNTRMRWVVFPSLKERGSQFSLRLCWEDSDLLLWGLRMIYEKGGIAQ